MNAQQVKKNLDFTAIILNQPCDWNQQSEQLVFIERKDTERNRHVKEVLLIFLMILVRKGSTPIYIGKYLFKVDYIHVHLLRQQVVDWIVPHDSADFHRVTELLDSPWDNPRRVHGTATPVNNLTLNNIL